MIMWMDELLLRKQVLTDARSSMTAPPSPAVYDSEDGWYRGFGRSRPVSPSRLFSFPLNPNPAPKPPSPPPLLRGHRSALGAAPTWAEAREQHRPRRSRG